MQLGVRNSDSDIFLVISIVSALAAKKFLYGYIGLRLRALREENGLTQAEAAALIQKSHQTYSNYEKADNFITLDCLYTLANHYKISVKRLLPDSTILSEMPDFQEASSATKVAEAEAPFTRETARHGVLQHAEEMSDLILSIKNPDIRESILVLLRTLVAETS